MRQVYKSNEARTPIAVTQWAEIRAWLRRYPWVDYVLAGVLVAWGAAAEIDPAAIIHGSHFGAFGAAVRIVGLLSGVTGIAQFSAAHRRNTKRRGIVSFLGVWILISFFVAVNSITGKIAWGALTFEEALVFLAVIEL